MRRLIGPTTTFFAALAGCVILAVACLLVGYELTNHLHGQKQNFTGTIMVHDDDPVASSGGLAYANSRQGKSCTGASISSGYSDMAPGAQVVVKDGKSNVIAVDYLGAGSWRDSTNCVLPFLVKDVPKAAFYSIEVSHRGEQRYSASDLAARNYSIDLTLGG